MSDEIAIKLYQAIAEDNEVRKYSLEEIKAFLDQTKQDGECLLWQGRIKPNGYGAYYFRKKILSAHRLAYSMFVGELTKGLEVDHICHSLDKDCAGGDNDKHRGCVNPDHLEQVTHKENVLRGRGPKAVKEMFANKTHCNYGHPYDIDIKTDKRYCAECKRLAEIRTEIRREAMWETV